MMPFEQNSARGPMTFPMAANVQKNLNTAGRGIQAGGSPLFSRLGAALAGVGNPMKQPHMTMGPRTAPQPRVMPLAPGAPRGGGAIPFTA